MIVLTQQEVIKAFIKSLDETEFSGRAALDEAVRACSNFESYQTLVDRFKADVEASGDNYQRFLIEKCGIILNNEDAGAITGSDAGGSEVKTNLGILPAEGEAVYPEGSEFTVNGLTIYGVPDRSTLTEQEQLVVQGLYSWWIKDSLNLIEETYGLTLDGDITNRRLKLNLYSNSGSTVMAYVSLDGEMIGAKNEVMSLNVNMATFKDITEDNVHGYVAAQQDSLDRTLAHELTHALMAVNIDYSIDLPHWLQEGAAELIVGIDEARFMEFGNTLTTRRDQLFDMLNINAIGSDYPYTSYTGGVIFLRYLAKQAGDQTFDYDTFRENVTVDNGVALNYFDNVSMSGSSDADTIENYVIALVNGGAGNDTLRNVGDNATVNGGTGNDVILNGNFFNSDEGRGVTINGDEGDDQLFNVTNNVTMNGGEGNDTITNSGSDVLMLGDDGNDQIDSEGANTTVNGGAGDDTIVQSASLGAVFGDAGNDYISVTKIDNTINGGEGNDTIINSGDYNQLYGGAGNDSIINRGDYNQLDGGEGDDSIENRAEAITIVGGDGNDLIRDLGQKVSIESGAGNDTIIHEGFVATIDAGDGNDLIRNSGDYATLTGGAGNDTFMISDGMGVVISDFNSVDDVISIASGGASIANADGSITINFSNTVETVDNSNDSPQVAVIKRFMASLDQTEMSGRAALDEAVRASSDFESYDQLVDRFRDDFASCNGNWAKFLQQYCGIKLGNRDTGAITGSDAGGSTVKTNATIVELGEYDEDEPYPEGSEFTVDGLTIYGIPDRDELTDDQQVVVKNLYNHWLKGGLDLIKESYGLSYNEEGTTNHRLCLRFMDDNSDGMLAAVVSNSVGDDFKECGGAQLVINMAYFEDADEEDLTAEDIHRSIAHELVHGLMSSNFNYYGDLPNWFIEGAAELVVGIDDSRRTEFPIMFTDESIVDYINELEFSGDNQPYPIYTAGYTFLRYFAHQAAGDQTYINEDNYISNYVDGETITPSNAGTMIENTGDHVVIDFDGETGNVHNYGTGSTIEGGGNFSAIINNAEYVYIEGGETVDFITNNAADATINVDAGNDAITNRGERALIEAGDGNDNIENSAHYMTWGALEQNEIGRLTFTVHNDLRSGADSTIDGGNGNDSITNQSDRAYINGGNGNDTLQNVSVILNPMMTDDDPSSHSCIDATLDGGAGNDVLINTLDSAWLIGGDGSDSIYNGGDEVWIEGDGSDDTIISSGDDTITNSGDEVSIYGGRGDDLIRNAGADTTIDGDLGEDTIINEGRLVSIDAGDGNDLIRSSGDHATLIGGNGADTFVVTDGVGVVIADYNPDEDMISIAGDVEGVTTINSTVASESDFITVDGSFINYEGEATLVGGSNADTIISGGVEVLILSGGGNDSIRNEGYGSFINAGGGNDFIRSNGDHSTIVGGAGSDTFVVGDGTGVFIADFNADEDIISLASGASSIQNDDGSIAITVSNPVEPVDSTAYTPQIGVMKRFMASLSESDVATGIDLDAAISAASNGSLSSYQSFVDRFRADYNSCGDNWNKFLLKYCGINLYNDDIGALVGADAGGTLTGETDLIDVSGDASYPSGDTFTVNGLTIYNVPDQSELTDAQQTIIRGLNSWWIGGSIDLINRSYGLTFNEETTRTHRLDLFVVDDEDEDGLAAVAVIPTDEGAEAIALMVNMYYFKDVDADDHHGLSDGDYLDRTLAHELTHALMGSNIAAYRALPDWIIEGSAELIRGVEPGRDSEIRRYAQNGDALLDMLNDEADDDYISYAGGYIALRYMAKQFSGQTFDYDEYRSKITGNEQVNYFDDVKMLGASTADTIANAGSNVTIKSKGGDDRVYNYGGDVKIDLGAGNDRVDNYGDGVTIKGGKGDDRIENEGDDVIINGGAGNDLIISDGENATLIGGAGNDTFSVYNGSAWIKDYSAEKDHLNIGDGASTLESHGGILITFDATADQLSAMIDVDTATDELSEITGTPDVEVAFDDNFYLKGSDPIDAAGSYQDLRQIARRHQSQRSGGAR